MSTSFNVNGMAPNGTRFQNISVQVDITPDECPLCHRSMVPELVSGLGWIAGGSLEMIYRCTSNQCAHTFIALYKESGMIGQQRAFQFQKGIPTKPKEQTVDEEISKLSPSFASILAQAQAAESFGLDDIAGPGFRKALEFLIKDYAISLAKDEAAKVEIRQILLGRVIDKYLAGDKLPIVLKRATWLGNDETHYERRWVGKDLQDLKKLISAVQHFIAMEILAASLPTEMPDPNTTQKNTP